MTDLLSRPSTATTPGGASGGPVGRLLRLLSGRPPGGHRIDGIGAGFVVPLWHPGLADDVECVSTEEARSMALRLAREEGVFAGTSTGANVVAALRLAEALGPGATIVTVMCDTGMKYLRSYAA